MQGSTIREAGRPNVERQGNMGLADDLLAPWQSPNYGTCAVAVVLVRLAADDPEAHDALVAAWPSTR